MSNNRRYYLHRKLKAYFNVDARSRQVSLTEKALEAAPEIIKEYLQELLQIGYNIQYEIYYKES